MTSLISKFTWPCLLAGPLLLLLSCSSTKPSSDENSIRLDDELNSLSQRAQVINYGPTNSSGTAFEEKTEAWGLNDLYAVAINAIDVNFDGNTDLAILPTYYSRPRFMIASGGKFVEWKHDPLPQDFKASFLLFYDLNKDNILDLVAGVLNQRSEVGQVPVKFYAGKIVNGLLNFIEDPKALKLTAEPTSSISVVDYDLDGWPDLFIGNWFENKNGQYIPVADRFLRNNKGIFVDITPTLKEEANKLQDQLYPPNAKPTYGSSTCDIDQNGFPDILTVSSSGHRNKLWMNLMDPQTGERYFKDIGPESNYASDPDGNLIPTGGGRSFISTCTDYNDDGIMDVFMGELSHAYDNDSVDRSSILTGTRQTWPPYFMRTEYVSDATSEAWNQGDRRAVWMDYNVDGRIDILVDNSGFPPHSRLVMFEQDETHAFINVGPQSGIDIVNPSASITIDLNRDGLLDIITSQNNIRRSDISARLYVFENKKRQAGRKSIRVYLNGIKSNTHGLGAMVMLFTKNNDKKIVQRRWAEYTQGGLASQNEEGVHFGVDIGMEAVGLKVKWPYLQRSGLKSGQIVEKLYSLVDFPAKEHLEVTVCEDGKILLGKMSCQF